MEDMETWRHGKDMEHVLNLLVRNGFIPEGTWKRHGKETIKLISRRKRSSVERSLSTSG